MAIDGKEIHNVKVVAITMTVYYLYFRQNYGARHENYGKEEFLIVASLKLANLP